MTLAIGEQSEYIELFKSTYFDCIAELNNIKAMVIKLKSSEIWFQDIKLWLMK